jgi:glycosyltransferase involved in cell wall biosynthesis
MMKELGDKIDPARVHFMGKVPYDQHLTLLKRSDAHVYLSYPFVASWSLREALAAGCVVIGADTETVTEFVKHNQNGLVVPTIDHVALTSTVLRALKDTKLAARLRTGARAYAEKHFDMQDYLARYRAYIEEITGKKLIQPVAAPKVAKPQPPAKKPRARAA